MYVCRWWNFLEQYDDKNDMLRWYGHVKGIDVERYIKLGFCSRLIEKYTNWGLICKKRVGKGRFRYKLSRCHRVIREVRIFISVIYELLSFAFLLKSFRDYPYILISYTFHYRWTPNKFSGSYWGWGSCTWSQYSYSLIRFYSDGTHSSAACCPACSD